MLLDNLIGYAALALLAALVISFLMTPVVKTFAFKVGAVDVPKDARRMHKVPIPRLGGLAIFIGFMVSVLILGNVRGNGQMQSILLGSVIIVVLGVVDDIMALPAMLKFVIQIVAALIPALSGVVIPLLGAGPPLRALHGAVDRSDHQRREPHRRVGRPGQRRLRHLGHHHAGHRIACLRGGGGRGHGGAGGGLHGLHAL